MRPTSEAWKLIRKYKIEKFASGHINSVLAALSEPRTADGSNDPPCCKQRSETKQYYLPPSASCIARIGMEIMSVVLVSIYT